MSLRFPGLPYKENKTDYYIELPNGSEVWIAGLDDAKRVEKILGKEYSTLYFNECSQISYKSIQVALTRLAEKNELTKKAYFDENPPSKKHWSYWLFFKHIDPIDNKPVHKKSYSHILMNPEDNIENIDKDYLTEVLDKLSDADKDRFKYGKFAEEDDGQAYYAFNRDKHVTDFNPQLRGTTLVGMDFNVSPMTAVICAYQNGIFYVFDEAFLGEKGWADTFKMTAYLKEKGYSGAKIYPDSTGKNRRTSGKSDHLILEEAGFYVERTFNPLVIDRVNNINRLLTQDRIKIHESCHKLITDLEKVSWKDGVLDQKSDKTLTHISDALGYLCWGIDPIEHDSGESSTIIL
jgi:phage terminase large subunit